MKNKPPKIWKLLYVLPTISSSVGNKGTASHLFNNGLVVRLGVKS